MIYDLAISEGAHDDITRNAVWWSEHHSYDQAIRWRDAIYEQLETLRERPEQYPVAAENRQFNYELRQKLVGLGNRRSYRAVFTIHNQTVYVLAVHRAAQGVIWPGDLSFDPDG